jgi:hypothetical protein
MRLGTGNRQQNVYEQAERNLEGFLIAADSDMVMMRLGTGNRMSMSKLRGTVWKGWVAGSVGLNDLSLLTGERQPRGAREWRRWLPLCVLAPV